MKRSKRTHKSEEKRGRHGHRYLNHELMTSLRQVLDYLMDDERASFEALSTGEERERHIFPNLVLLNHWLSQVEDLSRRPSRSIDPGEVLDTLEVTKVEPRENAGGSWADGKIAGHRFNALVFPSPAVNRTWEVNGDSRISKLWLQRSSDGATVYNWDRGLDIEPQTAFAGLIVDLLADGLANLIHSKDGK